MKYKINKRQIIVFIIIIIFTIFLYQFNQIDKVQLYHQNGKSFESGEVVDIIQDNIMVTRLENRLLLLNYYLVLTKERLLKLIVPQVIYMELIVK